MKCLMMYVGSFSEWCVLLMVGMRCLGRSETKSAFERWRHGDATYGCGRVTTSLGWAHNVR